MTTEQFIKIEEFVHEARMSRVKPFVAQLAAHVGVTPQTIYNWEKDFPPVSVALADLKALREIRRTSAVMDADREESASTAESAGMGRAAWDDEDSLAALSEADLAAHARPWLRRLRMQMGQAHELATRHGNLADLPFLVYRMEQTLGQMHQVMPELRRLRDEWQRRYEPGAPSLPQEELFSSG